MFNSLNHHKIANYNYFGIPCHLSEGTASREKEDTPTGQGAEQGENIVTAGEM